MKRCTSVFFFFDDDDATFKDMILSEAKDLVPVYWCEEAFKPVPFEIYTKH